MNIAFKTLLYREVKRFLNVYNQTIIAPIINCVLYFVIFSVIFKKDGLHQQVFIASGIIMMSVLQNAYANTQSTITTAKVLGFLVDFIIPPISIKNLLFAIFFSGIIRGLIVAILGFITLSIFVNFHFYNIFLMFCYIFFAAGIFSFLGIIVGSVSKNFDSAMSYNTYIIMPVTFLSGTFYSVKMLSAFWQKVIAFNPVFYIIDGFRYSIIGTKEAEISSFATLSILSIVLILMGLIAYCFMKKKYHEI